MGCVAHPQNPWHFSAMRLLRTIRLVLGIPVHALAAEAGVSVRELHRLERGAVRPKHSTLAKLDAALEAILERRARHEAGSL